MRFTRHARNGMRWLDLSPGDIEWICAYPVERDADEDGRPRYTAEVRGRLVRVVLALDAPDLVVTVHPRRRTQP
jgi:hypothetical protein